MVVENNPNISLGVLSGQNALFPGDSIKLNGGLLHQRSLGKSKFYKKNEGGAFGSNENKSPINNI